MLCVCYVFAMFLLCFCFALGMFLLCFCYVFAMLLLCFCYAFVMFLQCFCYAYAILLPCFCYAFAMLLLCFCCAFAMLLLCFCYAFVMRLPCFCFAFVMLLLCFACESGEINGHGVCAAQTDFLDFRVLGVSLFECYGPLRADGLFDSIFYSHLIVMGNMLSSTLISVMHTWKLLLYVFWWQGFIPNGSFG